MPYECRSVLPVPTEHWHQFDADSPEVAVHVVLCDFKEHTCS
jgi:hypothetical protein